MGVLSRQYYEQLAQEAEQEKRISSMNMMNAPYQKLWKTLGLTNPIHRALAPIALSMGAMTSPGQHALQQLTGLSSDLTELLAFSPLLIQKFAGLVSRTAPQAKQEFASLEANQFRDYGVAAQAKHFARTTYKLGTAAGAGVLGAGLSGMIGGLPSNLAGSIANIGAHLNPLSLATKAGAGLAGMLGLPDVVGSIGLMFALAKATGGSLASPTSSRKVQVPSMQIGKISDLLMRSTYKNHMQSIITLKNMNLLKPGEVLMASILNDINLNTSALLPIYEKFFNNFKEVQNAETADNLAKLFTNDKEEKFDDNYTKSKHKHRKALFHFLTSLELGSVETLYKSIGSLPMKWISGKSYEDFLEEKQAYKLSVNDGYLNALQTQAKKLNISVSGINVLTKDASDFLQAPDYESRMLGLVAGIFELEKIIAKRSLGAEGASSLDDIIEKHMELFSQGKYKDAGNILESNLGLVGRLISGLYKTTVGPLFGKAVSIFTGDTRTLKERYLDNFKDLIPNLNIKERLKDIFLEGYGTYTDLDTIRKTYKSEKRNIAEKFDTKKAAFDYLGTHLPDDMTEIIKELKQQTLFLHDLVKINGYEGTYSEWNRDKWRGAFSKFMNDENFGKLLAKKAFNKTRELLGIEKITNKTGFLSTINPMHYLKKALGVYDEVNDDIQYLVSLYKKDYSVPTNQLISNNSKINIRKKFETRNVNKDVENRKNLDLLKNQFLIQKEQLEILKQIHQKFACFLDSKGIKCKGMLGLTSINNLNKEADEEEDGLLDSLGSFLLGDAFGSRRNKRGRRGGKLSKTRGLFGTIIDKLKSFIKKVGKNLGKVFKGVYSIFKPLTSLISGKKKLIFGAAALLLTSITDIFTGIKNLFSKGWESLKKIWPFGSKSDHSLKIKKEPKIKVESIHETKEVKDIKKAEKLEGKNNKYFVKKEEKITKINKKYTTNSKIQKFKNTRAISKSFWQRFKKIATRKLLKVFGKEMTIKIMTRLGAAAGALAGGPIGWIFSALATLSLGWDLFTVVNLLMDAYHEAQGNDKESLTNEKELKTLVDKTENELNQESIPSKNITPIGHGNRNKNKKLQKSEINYSNESSADIVVQKIEELKQTIIEAAKIQTLALSELSKIMTANVNVNSQIASGIQELSQVDIKLS